MRACGRACGRASVRAHRIVFTDKLRRFVNTFFILIKFITNRCNLFSQGRNRNGQGLGLDSGMSLGKAIPVSSNSISRK